MTRTDDFGKLILRLVLGILILMHGMSKVMGGGVGGIAGMVTAHGLPAWVAYGAYIGEVVAPILIIVGLFTRPAACIVAINMLFAFYLVHMKDLTAMGKTGGWALELQGMFLFTALASAFLGAGKYSVGGTSNRFN